MATQQEELERARSDYVSLWRDIGCQFRNRVLIPATFRFCVIQELRDQEQRFQAIDRSLTEARQAVLRVRKGSRTHTELHALRWATLL